MKNKNQKFFIIKRFLNTKNCYGTQNNGTVPFGGR